MAPKRKAKPPPSDDDTGSDYEESLGAPSDESDSDYEAEDEPTPKKKAPPRRGDLRPPWPCEVQQEPQTRLQRRSSGLRAPHTPPPAKAGCRSRPSAAPSSRLRAAAAKKKKAASSSDEEDDEEGGSPAPRRVTTSRPVRSAAAKKKASSPPEEVTQLPDGWTLHPPSFMYK